MKTFEDSIISRLQLLEREVERLRVGDKAVAITDHGALSGLSDDDHPQYLLAATGKAADSDKLDGKDSTDFSLATHNHDTAYLGITAKAADSDKLDGNDSAYFMPISYKDGWQPDTDTWVYVSATQFKITGKNVVYRFPVGAKIKLTQSGSVKYFYVTAASYSTDTTITITGGSDYSLANAAISAPRYSYAETPQGFPTHFNYAPTVSYVGGTADPTSFSFLHSWFTVTGSLCSVLWEAALTRGSGDRTYVKITLPINYSMTSSGSITITFNGARICPNYLQASPARVSIYVGGMNSDGYLFGQLNYLIA